MKNTVQTFSKFVCKNITSSYTTSVSPALHLSNLDFKNYNSVSYNWKPGALQGSQPKSLYYKGTSNFSTTQQNTHKPIPKIDMGGDFADLVEKSSIFIDKSLFIKEIIDDSAKVILITMPRRWGKSLNLDMLKRFLSVEEQNEVTKELNTKLFAGGEIDLGGIKGKQEIPISNIAKEEGYLKLEQGKYPVIFIDFKDCKGGSFKEVKDKLQKQILDTVAKFSYLNKINAEFRFSTIKENYNELVECIKNGDFENSLKDLSALLHSHHGKKVWILIDEYDAAANKAYLEFADKGAQKISELFRSIFEPALKGNEYLEKGVMTGVQYILKSGMLSGLNNLSKYNVTDTKYSKYYGINQDEMDVLLSSFDLNPAKNKEGDYTDDRVQDIKSWYNGYKERQIGADGQYNGHYIDKYNIWSVVNYLNNPTEFKSHWEKSGSVEEIIHNVLKNEDVKNQIIKLISGDKFPLTEPNVDFNVKDFKNLKEIKNSGINKTTEAGQNLFFSYLFITGYFTLNNDGLFFPNKELSHEMNKYVTKFFQTEYNISTIMIEKTIKTFSSIFDTKDAKSINNIFKDNVGSQFQEIIQRSPGQQDDNEDIVHSLLNYIIRQIPGSKSGTETVVHKQFDGKLKYKIIDSEKFVYKDRDEDNFYKLEKGECDKDVLNSIKEKSKDNIKPVKGKVDVWISKNDVGLISEMKYQKNLPQDKDGAVESAKKAAIDALAQAKEYAELIKNDPLKIFIGCNVTDQQEVFISGSIEQEGQDAITFDYPPSC
jgi:hypothetical protein